MNSAVQEWKPQWRKRAQPLLPVAGWFCVDLVEALRVRLAGFSQERLEQLRVVVAQEGILVFGEASYLPWINGAVWLGRDDAAPELMQPTLWETDLPAVLLQQACLKKTGCAVALIYASNDSSTLMVPVDVAKSLVFWLYPEGIAEIEKQVNVQTIDDLQENLFLDVRDDARTISVQETALGKQGEAQEKGVFEA